MTKIIQSFSEISSQYKVALVDLWGCVHDGLCPFAPAVAALQAYRREGGKVVLFTNSPRTRFAVEKQIAEIGVAGDAWDTIVTSGDSARAGFFAGNFGQRIFVIGESDDMSFFEPMKIMPDGISIERVAFEEAEGIICLGPDDPHADLECSRPLLQDAAARGLKLLCVNPDILVERGRRREWCAGAVAKLYTEIGGESFYFGKPHAPIYDLAWVRLASIGIEARLSEVIAIGDGVGTDVKGAADYRLDCLFVSGGLSAKETGTAQKPDPNLLSAYFAKINQNPKWTIGTLR